LATIRILIYIPLSLMLLFILIQFHPSAGIKKPYLATGISFSKISFMSISFEYTLVFSILIGYFFILGIFFKTGNLLIFNPIILIIDISKATGSSEINKTPTTFAVGASGPFLCPAIIISPKDKNFL